MNYDNLTVESIAQYCAEKSGFKINKADLESQIQHLIDIEKAKQLNLSGVSNFPSKKVTKVMTDFAKQYHNEQLDKLIAQKE